MEPRDDPRGEGGENESGGGSTFGIYINFEGKSPYEDALGGLGMRLNVPSDRLLFGVTVELSGSPLTIEP